MADFHNPYNFVAAPPRPKSLRKDPNSPLGDHAPPTQLETLPDHYSGRIRVQMTIKTPLLLPETDPAKVHVVGDDDNERRGHKTFPLRVDREGKPLVPASSVRGMLRSAYEAITNSRFGRFSYAQHSARLAFRMDARSGVKLIPARVQNGRIQLLTGTSSIRQDGKPDGPMYAAWLRRYRKKNPGNAKDALKLSSEDGLTNKLPEHYQRVSCWLQRVQHKKRDGKPDFQYWAVRKIVPAEQALGDKPTTPMPSSPSHEPQNDWNDWKEVEEGWVCITNQNISNKHDERVFFGSGPSYECSDDLKRMWRELILDYQQIHIRELEQRQKRSQDNDEYLGDTPGKTAWSRHVYTKSDAELSEGTLCYVRLTPGDHQTSLEHRQIEGIFPVMIARELYKASPWDLLPSSLLPASTLAQLSPADRVFGWVRVDTPDRNGSPDSDTPTSSTTSAGSSDPMNRVAHRGLLQVGPIRCESSKEEACEKFNPPLPLAILAAPKPQQGRFYVATSSTGQAQSHGIQEKLTAGYSEGKGLRGRKVYPHHRGLPDKHWAAPTTYRPEGERGVRLVHHQEYRRPDRPDKPPQDDQNRSVKGWVRPDTRFSFDLHVHNLSQVELGALLWLLELPDDHYLRLGGGKPLGFGSVRLSLDGQHTDLRCGPSETRNRYTSWSPAGAGLSSTADAKEAFEVATRQAYKAEHFDDIDFIKGFLVACYGFRDGLPIHYPRATDDGNPGPPSPEGESFKWFVANEKKGGYQTLGNLHADRGLKTLVKPK